MINSNEYTLNESWIETLEESQAEVNKITIKTITLIK